MRRRPARRSGGRPTARIDAFTCAVGTGGTLAGVGIALKEKNPDIRITLADPLGSALYNFYAKGELKAEGNSITEGIGQGRITKNLEGAPIDDALQVTDEEALPLIFDLLKNEGSVPGRVQRHQCHGGDEDRAGSWPRPYGRDDPVRLRDALPVEAVQSSFPAGKEFAGTVLAGASEIQYV